MFAPEFVHGSWLVTEAIPELNALPGMHITLTSTGIIVSREYPLRLQEVLGRCRARMRPLAGMAGGGAAGAMQMPDEGVEFSAVRVLRRKGPLALLA
jgi:hypothetical protein